MGRSLPILGVPGVLGEHKRTLIITDFTQSLGAELLTNGDFSAWTGDNPDGWSVSGESGTDPEVTERDPNQGHAGVKTIGGAANFYRTAAGTISIGQTVCTVNHWYETRYEQTNRVVGEIVSVLPFGFIGWGGNANVVRRYIGRANNTSYSLYNAASAIDITLDNVSLKRVILNAQQEMPSADAEIVFRFTPPASPAALDRILVLYRISDASLEAAYSCWQAYLYRNTANTDWDFRLDSVSAGTATNRIAVTGVGNAVGIRVQCAGTLHDCWTTANGVDWTKRGAQINVSHNDTQTGVNTVYSSQATPTKLTVTPL